jgi:hypothetical protein
MEKIITLGVMLLAASILPVYAQGGAEPQVPPPVGGQIEPAPADTTGGVLDVPEAAAEAVPEGSVARSTFTSGIQDREPVDQLTEVTTPSGKIYFFTELRDLDGQTVQHRWLYQGQVVAEVAFNVGGSRWRVWSNKSLQPDQLGTWTVEVVDGNGRVIASANIEQKEGPGEKPPVPLASEPAPAVAAQR